MKKFLALIIITMYLHGVHATNISVSAVALSGQNTAAGVNNAANYYEVGFNLSWTNSWNLESAPESRDAAWVFAKARVGVSDITLNNVNSTGITITVSSTANLRKGMPVSVLSGTGNLSTSTVISSIVNATQFTVSALPTTALVNATILCSRFWEHIYFNNTDYTESATSTITPGLLSPGVAYDLVSNPVVGVYVHNTGFGAGLVNEFNNLKLKWNYVPISGIRDNDYIEIRVFAIEMVYVPGNVPFNVGGGGGTGPLQSTYITTSNTTLTGGFPQFITKPTITNFPNGYNAFYCMKYEISQGQYRDFLNTLTLAQQITRAHYLILIIDLSLILMIYPTSLDSIFAIWMMIIYPMRPMMGNG